MLKWASLAAAAAAIAAGAASIGTASAQEEVKACWIYVGPIGDHGWSYQHEQGRLHVEEVLGDKVETVYIENVSEGPDAERTIERLARDGCAIIFTTSFGFMEPTLKVAAKYPDVKFEHATGFKRTDNVATYNAKFHEGRYVIGQIAARVSETGTAGYVGSFPIPEVVSGINAFMLGAQSIDPEFKVRIVWVNSWYDPGKEADAAKVLFGQGADIISQHTDSTAPLQIAEEEGKHGFGQASDMIRFAPNAQLTAIVDDWSGYYVERVQAVLDGTWEPVDVWGGLDSGMVSMAPFTNMPDDVAKMASETTEAIASGELHPFTGPIHNQAGELVVEEGETLSDGDVLGMNWYVQGIDDQLPN
jgi:simple sugar transport system substrate-binding protein